METVAEVEQNRINEQLLAEMQLKSSEEKDLDLIFFISEGVRLYTIEGTEASTPTIDSSLQLLRYPDDISSTSNSPSALIQVGTWLYPLNKATPVLLNDSRTFLVANPTPNSPSLSVAIVLDQIVSDKIVEEFTFLLNEYSDLHELTQEVVGENTKASKSERITNYLVSGGEKIAGKIQLRAARWNKRLVERGERYRSTEKPRETPTHIAPVVKGGVKYVHKGTKVVAKVTDKLFEKIGEVGTAVGKAVATGATKVIGDNETAEKSIKMVGGGFGAAGSVLFSLVIAGKSLGKTFSTQTVENVRYKYGEEASETTKKALSAAGHGGTAVINITQITPTAIVRRVGMGVGVQTITDLHTNVVGQPIPLRIPGMAPPPQNTPKMAEKEEMDEESEENEYSDKLHLLSKQKEL